MAYTTETNTGLRTPVTYSEDDLWDIHSYNVQRLNNTLLLLEEMLDVFMDNVEDKDILVWDSVRQKYETVDCPQQHRLVLLTTTTTTTTTSTTTTTT